ncbi:alkaline phosphatase PhoX [Pseudonocardia nigra]|uniref:alkaline phosphatase PhoX n=1 Tax=Pseudonocardia nigra TaxID=1921578 RepID=UPI001C5E0EF4|nr:alkaline phosphatase PhoX [Pseudonocardia nigra]
MTRDDAASGIGRRTFLRGTGAAIALSALMTGTAAAQGRPAPAGGGYGPLVPAPGGELLLPEGFTYVAFGRTGEPMSDGTPTPGSHDGMAAFAAGPNLVRLVRNHERGAAPAFASPSYDPQAGGGTTTIAFDTAAMAPVSTLPSLAGTIRNCAGGPTPKGSWLSCEETFTGLDVPVPHGYVFEVPATADAPVQPVPLKAMGRFVHEAVAVDPATGIVYETEDAGLSGLYRFVPNNRDDLAAGGTLEMLAIKDRPQYDTRTGQRVGPNLPVTWVPIADPDPDSSDSSAVYNQGHALGGATFARLEGAWWGDGAAYIVSTSGGDLGAGQVWEYRPRGNSGGQLRLVYESTDRDVLESPDNITVSPRTNGLVLCEDGGGKDFVRGVSTDGEVFPFCEVNGGNSSEWAGATFSPDGKVLFVNLQTPGVSYAITGPWERGAL